MTKIRKYFGVYHHPIQRDPHNPFFAQIVVEKGTVRQKLMIGRKSNARDAALLYDRYVIEHGLSHETNILKPVSSITAVIAQK